VPVRRLNELENRRRYVIILNVTASQLVSDVHGHITRAAFGGVEGHYADRAFILSAEQVTKPVVQATREGWCYQHVQAIIVAIDQYAEAATGNRDFFLNKPHSLAGGNRG
jgi:hypothetical protein